MSNEHEYKPLADLIREGMEPGTVLMYEGGCQKHIWDGKTITHEDGSEWVDNPFYHLWRIVSTPPKRIEFEAIVCWNRDHDRNCVLLPPSHDPFHDNQSVKVTIEEVQK